jgi:cell division septum initiation protein DivIVA
MLTDHELKLLLQRVNHEFQGTFQRLKDLEDQLAQLETKVEELSNAKESRPKTSTGGSKRVQQAKANA